MKPPGRSSEDVEGVGARLRAFVLARTVAGSRVALLGEDEGLARGLAEAGCTVWTEGAPGPEALGRFAPTHVVLTGSTSEEGLEARLSALLAEAPEAEILLGFANAGAASALIATLVDGAPSRRGPSEARFRHCLAAWGLRVVHREAHAPVLGQGALAVGTERALGQFMAQLEPGAGDDVLLYALARATVDAGSTPREPGLLSVVLWNGPEHRHLLDEAVLSLACQRYRSLEIVLVEPEGVGADLGEGVRTLERYRRIEDFRFQQVRGLVGGLMDEGIRRARGQYLAFFEASGLVYPGHFEKLIEALREAEGPWAVSRAFLRVSRAIPGADDYVETKVPFPLGGHLELAHLRQHPWLLHALVIDRSRIANFPLHLPDPAPGRAAALLLRLAAAFEPVFLDGLATCEQRVPEAAPPVMEAGTEALWLLRSLDAVEQAVARARAAGQGGKDLRHRVLDEVNARLRHSTPWLHGALRSTVARWLK